MTDSHDEPPAQTTREDRPTDLRNPMDTDGVAARTETPDDDSVDTGFDGDAPGNYVDDEDAPTVPEPNEPA